MAHGGDIYGLGRPVLDFSANANFLGLPDGVRRAAEAAVRDCVRYPDPDCRALTAALAGWEGVPPEWILCGNGAADLIFRLALALRPRRALLPAPTFSEYARALEAVGCETVLFPLREENGFRLGEAFLEAVRPGVDLVFLCNPNNPTGCTAPRALLERIAARCGEVGAVLALDECFLPFTAGAAARSLTGALGRFPHLLILKAFTKIFAMPGLRLGYALCAGESLLRGMRRCGQPWSVSAPAQAAGCAAVRENAYLAETLRLLPPAREALRAGLEALPLRVFPPEANYIFFRAPGREDLREALLRRDLLIRQCGDYPGLSGEYYRVAVRAPEENAVLLAALREVLP